MATFYKNLYHNSTHQSNPDLNCLSEIPQIILEETIKKIRHIKPGKSSGIDQIHAAYLQSGGEITAKALT